MKMAHVTIMTTKLEESVEFYQKIVGLNIIRDMRNTDHPIVFLADQPGDTCVELCYNPQEAFSGVGISMGFPVEDVEVKRAECEALGLHPSPMISPNPHVRFFFVKDPSGMGIQFLTEN